MLSTCSLQGESKPLINGPHFRRFPKPHAIAGIGCLAFFVVLLSACSPSTPLPQLRPDVPAKWRNAAPQADALGPAPNLDSWWQTFDDTRLDKLINTALAQNLDLKQAQLRLQAARAMHHRRSDTPFRPHLSFHTFSEPDPAATTSYYEIGFDATWEFGFFGRGLGNDRVAAADLQAAANDIVAARVSLIAEITRDYMDLRAAQARVKILRHIEQLRRKQAQLVRTRLRLHLASQADLEQANNKTVQAQADAEQAAQAITQAEQALAVLLAEPEPGPGILQPGPQPALPDVRLTRAPADLLRTRPEIRHAELDVLRAAGELGIAKANLYPKLALGGTLISSTRLVGDLDRPNKAIPSGGPLIDIPLLDWGARRDVVNARDAQLKAATLAYRQAVLAGVAEAETALSKWQHATRVLKTSDTLLGNAKLSEQRTRKLQQIGLADSADNIASEIAASQSRLQRVSARHARAVAFIAVYKSLGGTLPPLHMDVN